MEYHFKCNECGKVFSVEQRMNEEHTAKHCAKKAQRVWNVVKHSIAFREGLNY